MSRPDLHDVLAAAPVVPLVQSDDPDAAIDVSRALLDGGLTVLEVVLRTDRAFDCLRAIVKAFPDTHVGAGTVLTPDDLHRAVDCGASFIVCPGLVPEVVAAAQKAGVPILPGVATASEAQQAWNMGLKTVKFFPASLAGGPKMLGALSSVYREMRFMPTGGVNAKTLPDYLAVPSVIACGGSWLTPKDAVAEGDYARIKTIASDALGIAKAARPG